MLTAFLALLLAYSTHNLITGTAPVPRVLGLVLVHRSAGGARPGHALDLRSGDEVGTTAATEAARDRGGNAARPPLRPVGHHRAA
ncbi:hypothetical protein CLV71_114167 [Actinophytocola oryzae]|uniref:Uncharacterized protein n=1 Tax=Actinophytocola oryzae TaxID=502181 RepID=A0A4R7V6E6_9PSEU|nr:hypothetical protein CLV71_114167 [Actinophytocola oryzae]